MVACFDSMRTPSGVRQLWQYVDFCTGLGAIWKFANFTHLALMLHRIFVFSKPILIWLTYISQKSDCHITSYMKYAHDLTHAWPWWRHQMETFFALLAICTGNSPVTGEFPSQRQVTWNFEVFFNLHLNKRLSKQWWDCWFETPTRPFWHHCNVHE